MHDGEAARDVQNPGTSIDKPASYSQSVDTRPLTACVAIAGGDAAEGWEQWTRYC